ncbi:MAG: arylsulfatase [Ginsengibacter sp.]
MLKQIIFSITILFVGITLAHIQFSGVKPSSGNTENRKPNVILILTDDQGDGDLSCNGSPYVKTPILDSLQNQSIKFTDFHVDVMCSPTRAALLTGCYSPRAGIWHTTGGRSLLKEGIPTIADLFKENGYETGIFGKWHLGENYPFRPMDRGFKESVVFGGGLIGDNPDFWGNNYFDDTYKHNGTYQKYKGYCNTVWFTEAINYIKENKDKPFFCYIPTNIPHAPLTVDAKYSAPYKDKVSDRLANYYGMISKLDEDIGIFLTQLKEMGGDKNTILIFMSDNGPCPWFGGTIIDFETGFLKEGYSMGMRGGKIYGYENSQRVPFFIRWPEGGILGGKNINAISAQIDIMPTLIDLCKLQTPKTLKYDGRSLAPLLTGKITDWSDDRTLIVHNQRVDYPVKNKEYQVMTKKWRLVKRDKDELYDMTDNIGQTLDVAGQNPDVVKDLYHRYENWWNYVSVDFEKYNPIYIGTKYENPTILYRQDAHIRQGDCVWVVKVAKEGNYEVRVNRWPDESGKRIVDNKTGDEDQPINSVSLTVGNIHQTKKVTKEMKSVIFNLNIKAGVTCFETSLFLKDSKNKPSTGYVYVKYVGNAEQADLKKYIPTEPNNLLRDHYVEKVDPYN